MLPDINLLPVHEKKRSLLYVLFVLGLILALLMTGLLAYQYITVNGELKQTNARNQELTARKQTLELKIAEQVPDESASMEEAVVYAEKYVVPTSTLINQLMSFLPATGYMSRYNYQEGKAVIISHFETLTDASAYIAKLHGSNFLKNPIVNNIETFELEAPGAGSDDETANTSSEEPNSFELLPRYKVTYSFEINSAKLKKETEENE